MHFEEDNEIVTITYISVERKVGWYDQTEQQQQHVLSLFPTRITTSTKIFPIQQVLDISYRAFSNGNGLMYLHTTQGVFSFNIASNPTLFIRSYKKLLDENYCL